MTVSKLNKENVFTDLKMARFLGERGQLELQNSFCLGGEFFSCKRKRSFADFRKVGLRQ